MFFKDGLTKKIAVLILKIFTNGKNRSIQVVRISLSFDFKMDKQKTTILQRQWYVLVKH